MNAKDGDEREIANDVEWVVRNFGGTTVRFIVDQLRARASAVRDRALQSRDAFAEMELEKRNRALTRSERMDLNREMSETMRDALMHEAVEDALLVIAARLSDANSRREREGGDGR